ncbi:MAG: phosphatase PAP2 family protein, partial [Parcubacteria group bacterium]
GGSQWTQTYLLHAILMIDLIFIFGAKYLFIISIILICWMWFSAYEENKKNIIIVGMVALPLAFVLSLTARSLYDNPRPFVVGNFEPLISHERDNGFPSDHALLVGTLAALTLFFDRRLAVAMWTIAFFVGVSRVYVGVHHPEDVLASFFIALISVYATHLFLSRRKSDTIVA